MSEEEGISLGRSGERREGSRLRAMATAMAAGGGRNRPATCAATAASRELARERERGGRVGRFNRTDRFGPG